MRILGIGEPCPCCGQPLPEKLSRKNRLMSGYVAEGMALLELMQILIEAKELSAPADAAAPPPEPEHPAENQPDRAAHQSPAEEKRAIAQRLRDYRAAHGLGCLDAVAQKTAHRKGSRLPVDTLRDIAAGKAPKMELSEWRKIARALDLLEKEALDG